VNAEQGVFYKYLPYLGETLILMHRSYTYFAFNASHMFLVVRCYGDVCLGGLGSPMLVRYVRLHVVKKELFNCNEESYLTRKLSISKFLEDLQHLKILLSQATLQY